MNAIDDVWKQEIELVNEALEEYFDIMIKQVSRLGEWHREFYEHIKEYMTRGGKRLRPILVAIGHKAIKENIEIKYFYRAACSMEALHNGSLLHDDLIDHDETRRGGKTFHATYRDKMIAQNGADKSEDYGMTMAILGGDALINQGSSIINASDLEPDIAVKCLHYYQRAYFDLVNGVLLEIEMVNNPSISPEVYLEMINLKTAVLFETSLLMGASIARATDSQLNALKTFGTKVGQAFQIQDDILGSFGDESVTGKSADGDIREGKKTMLLIQAKSNSTPAQLKELNRLVGKPDMTDEK
ncbi:MAG: polyprenyl synthetase family protein, partial [Candidatus Thorarchaeota archaeon]